MKIIWIFKLWKIEWFKKRCYNRYVLKFLSHLEGTYKVHYIRMSELFRDVAFHPLTG